MANEPIYDIPQGPDVLQDAPSFDFPGDPNASTPQKPQPIVIDPSKTYQFGDITTSGQDLVRTLVMPAQNPEIETLKQSVAQLTQIIQGLQQPQQPQGVQPPETNLTRWVGQRFGAEPSQLDSLTPQDFIQGLMAMQQDTQTMIQGLNQAVPQQVQGILQQQTQAYQQVQSKEQALNQAIALFLQNKAQALSQPVDTIRPQYEYVIRSLKNSGTYLISDNPQQVSQYAIDELTAFDRQLGALTEASETAVAAASKQQNQRALKQAMGEMASIRANPRPPEPQRQQPQWPQPPPQNQLSLQSQPQMPTRAGLVDAEQVLQQLKQEKVPQRRY